MGDPDFVCGVERKVQAAPRDEGTAIVNTHSYRAPVLCIFDLQDRTQRYGNGCCSKSMRVETFATGCRSTGESASIPGCDDFMDGRLRRWGEGDRWLALVMP